jgi:membrane protease subunit HflK
MTDRISRAEGDAGKFLRIQSAYATAPSISRKRMYLDMIKDSLCNCSRIIVDPDIGEADVWLNNTMIPGLDQSSSPEGGMR